MQSSGFNTKLIFWSVTRNVKIIPLELVVLVHPYWRLDMHRPHWTEQGEEETELPCTVKNIKENAQPNIILLEGCRETVAIHYY